VRLAAIALFVLVWCLASACTKSAPPTPSESPTAWPYEANEATYNRMNLPQQARDYIENVKRSAPYPEAVRWALCHHTLIHIMVPRGSTPSPLSPEDWKAQCALMVQGHLRG
jgi:hypothetical protein